MKPLTMIVPMYNDQESLDVLMQLIVDNYDENLHYLIVDNGSHAPLELPANTSRNITVIRTSMNKGFGGGILEGIAKAKTEWIGWMPGNLKISPADIPKLINGFEFTQGSLLKCNRIDRPKFARIKTVIAGLIQSLICRTNMMETGGTPTICEKSFVLSLEKPPRDYVFESYVLYCARRKNLKVVRPNIHYGPRVFGSSHWQSGLSAEIRLMKSIIKGRKDWD